MSMPTYPSVPDMTRESVINQIIASIAMEELSLSHILNAEGEKLQYVLGTLAGSSGLQPTVDELLKVNESVHGTLSAAMQNQMFLHNKMSDAIAASTTSTSQGLKGEDGKTPTIGPNGNWFIGGVDTNVSATGGLLPVYVHLRNSVLRGESLAMGGNVWFDILDGSSGGTSLVIDEGTGTIIFNTPGVYAVNGVVKFDFRETTLSYPGSSNEVKIKVNTSEGFIADYSAPINAEQVIINPIITIRNPSTRFNLTNGSDNPIVYADTQIVSELSIYRIG